MMAIKKVDSVYVAYHIGDLALPVFLSLSCLDDFKQTLDLLNITISNWKESLLPLVVV